MSLPLTMAGYERTYRPPRSLREHVGAEVTAWELFRLEHDERAGQWAGATLASVVAAAEAESVGVLGCTECLDTGFYGIPDLDNPDLLQGLVRRTGNGAHETLTAGGDWEPWEPCSALEVLDTDLAGDLAEAIVSGASGLLRLYGQPRAFLPPDEVLSAGAPVIPQEVSGDSWTTYAVVPDEDPGAVLDLVRYRSGESERWEGAGWTPDTDIAQMSGVPMVELNDRQLEDVLAQLQPIVADAPLHQSPDPRAARLRRYWSVGRGAAKIRWNTPSDWRRCVRHLSKYLGIRARGYCQELHRQNTGVYTGSRFNVGGNGRSRHHLFSSGAPEASLLAAVQSRRMITEGKTDMPTSLLADGVYTETDDADDALLQALAASAIPVAPPDEWFDDPGLTKPTTLTITDEGRVFGHIAPWGVSHIGMAGAVPAPKNRSGQYAYFRTGQLRTASGKDVRVGQLTLAGGHAPLQVGAQAAVQHYDDTNSGVADVAVGEDDHGIWAAGALRPNVTAEQVRVMRACPVSGDWRPINGNLELVAACHVNVQGFPIAAAAYQGGAITALVAAGARQMAELRLAEQAEHAVVQRLAHLETLVAGLTASTPPPEPAPPPEADDNPAAAETQEPEPVTAPVEPDNPEFSDEELTRAGKISRARALIEQTRRQALRDRVHAATAAGAPPTMAERKAKPTIPGTLSFPIGNVADLKKAIHAYGRAGDKPAARKHIITQAYKLKRPDLIPDDWRSSK